MWPLKFKKHFNYFFPIKHSNLLWLCVHNPSINNRHMYACTQYSQLPKKNYERNEIKEKSENENKTINHRAVLSSFFILPFIPPKPFCCYLLQLQHASPYVETNEFNVKFCIFTVHQHLPIDFISISQRWHFYLQIAHPWRKTFQFHHSCTKQ